MGEERRGREGVRDEKEGSETNGGREWKGRIVGVGREGYKVTSKGDDKGEGRRKDGESSGRQTGGENNEN